MGVGMQPLHCASYVVSPGDGGDASLPWATVAATDVEPRAVEGVPEPPHDGAGGPGLELGLLYPHAFWVPGCMHILHAVSGDMLNSLTIYKDWFLPKLRVVVNLLTSAWLMERFAHQCLSEADARPFAFLFKCAVDASLAEWRWMSVIHSIRAVLDRQLPLSVFYSAKKMNFREQAAAGEPGEVPAGGDRPHPDQEADQKNDELQSILRAKPFWAYAHMLVSLENIVKDLETLFNACPCHPERRDAMLQNIHGYDGYTYKGKRAEVKECIMAGRVGPLLACGQWQEDLDTFMQTRTADVIGHTLDLMPEGRSMVLDDFSKAKARLSLVVNAKWHVGHHCR